MVFSHCIHSAWTAESPACMGHWDMNVSPLDADPPIGYDLELWVLWDLPGYHCQNGHQANKMSYAVVDPDLTAFCSDTPLTVFPFLIFLQCRKFSNFQMWSGFTGARFSVRYFYQLYVVLYCNHKDMSGIKLSCTLSIIPPSFFTSTPTPPPYRRLFLIAVLCWSASMRQNLLAASSNKDSNAHDLNQVLFQQASSSDTNQVHWLDSCPVLRPLFESVRVGSWKQHGLWLLSWWNATLGIQLKPRADKEMLQLKARSSSQTLQDCSTFWEIRLFTFLKIDTTLVSVQMNIKLEPTAG